MSDGLFVKISSTILREIETAGQGSVHLYLEMVATLMAGAVFLYILWMGYQTLAGKIQTPIQDLLWNLTKMAMILAFIDNSGGYRDGLIDALHGLKNGLSGNETGGVWATLDDMWSQTQILADTVKNLDPAGPIAPKFQGGIAALLVWAGALLFMGTAALIFLSADITMTVLGLTAPLFIFCLMFGFLRTMFNNWLQLIFSSILSVMFASLVISTGNKLMFDVMSQVQGQANDANLFTMGAMALIVGLVTAGLVLLSSKWATQLAGVGVDGAIQGMAMMGLGAAGWGASKTLGEGMKFGKGVGKGIAQGGDAKTKGGSEWAGKQLGRADDFAAGAYKYGGEGYKALQKMSKQAVENMKAR
ncbi:type IV secretion system protein, partial [Pseudomonas amygdali]